MPTPAFISEDLVKRYFTTESVSTRPTAWEVALHAGNPGAGDDNEVSSGMDASYLRQGVTFDASENGNTWEAINSSAAVFPAAAAGSSHTITHFTVRDGDGNCLAIAALPVPVPVVQDTVVNFAIGDIVVAGASQ